ncbi:hypothetical protein [Pseudonocardia cypriaca]|uniref:hypothetical protein n=1 Tax=Pseudonocardia cypriaca TaxID=882449 RepID=UPI001476D59A|nr:hypothetical protein [Pseudonocardia cypriaca]
MIAAAASGALVVAMTGTALASDGVGRQDCSKAVQDAEAALDTAARSELQGLDRVCESIPNLEREDAEDSDEGTPETTPAAAPDENSANAADSDDSSDEDGDDEKSEDKDKDENKDEDEDKSKDEDEDGAGDRDCADFDSQADAQAAFEESSNDEDGLDADDDGVACEDHFGTEDQQVAVHPRGGVATGGSALS